VNGPFRDVGFKPRLFDSGLGQADSHISMFGNFNQQCATKKEQGAMTEVITP